MAAQAIRDPHRFRPWRGRQCACTALALLILGAGQSGHAGSTEAGSVEAGSAEAETAAAEAKPSLPPAGPQQHRHAIGVQVGRFVFGKYAPNANNNFSTCTAISFCSEKGLFGSILSLTYTRRLWQRESNQVDADVGVAFAEQSVQLDNGQVTAISGGPATTVALLTLVPTYRLRLPKPFKAVSLGAGLGLSLATARVAAEQPYEIPLNTQLNLEIAIKPALNRGLEVVAALQHRCSFFGLLNQQDGRYSGSQWYSLGIRQWF